MLDGELRELDRNKRGIINPAEVYGQLKFICDERGYKPGWAYHKSQEYFGHRPPVLMRPAVQAVTGNSALGENQTHRLCQGAGAQPRAMRGAG